MAREARGDGEQFANGGLLTEVSRGLAAAVERAGVTIVRVDARSRVGASGVLWSPAGFVVTADHVIERERDIVVGLADGREVAGALVGRDPGTDLALLKLEGTGFPVAELAPLSELRVGHLALALGRGGNGVTATMGIVSAIGGPWRSRSGGVVEGYFRTDVVMYPGYSGGPLIDVKGRVIGLNSSWLARGMSMTIPGETVSRIADLLQRQGKVKHGYLGIRTQLVTLPGGLATQVGQQVGLLVVGVEQGGPAELSGMMLGDILIDLAGQAVRDYDALQAQLTGERVGQSVPATLVRGGQRQVLNVTIGERP